MKTIQTRYRDITREEAQRCYSAEKVADYSHTHSWEKLRGQPVEILSIPVTSHHHTVICGGPFYRVANAPGLIACPHIAEIGD